MNEEKDTIDEIRKISAAMSNEIQAPLKAISFNIQSLKRMLNAPAEYSRDIIQRKIDSIESKANHINMFLENLLDLAKTMVFEIQLKKNIIHTHDLIADVIDNCEKEDLSASVQIDNSIPNDYCDIRGDKDRLQQIFSNIIYNLISLNPTIKTVKIATRANGERTQFIIKDEANILDPSFLNTILDKFKLIKIKNLESISLYHAVSKWLIEAQQGKIWVESRDGLGTAFFIEMPRVNP